MAKRRSRKNKLNTSTLVAIVLVAVVLIAGLVGCLFEPLSDLFSGFSSGGRGGGGGGGSSDSSDISDGSAVTVHFIDVDQADCAVICTENGNIIIDAGMNASEDEMKAYIDKIGVKSFKYAIFTHPHEDHIGGAEVILKNYRVENVIIPDLAATTKVYNTMLDAIEETVPEENVHVIEAGEEFEFFVGLLKAKILGPVEIDDDPNNASVITKITYGKTKLLFMGDAEVKSEELLLKKYRASELDADIIKLGHHGSNTSSDPDFLRAVSPEVAIISCGLDNKYGHPNAETINTLEQQSIKYHRTDKEGTVICTITSGGYSFKTTK